MTSYTLPCLRCGHTAVPVTGELGPRVTCSRCGSVQAGDDYATLHDQVLRFRDEAAAGTPVVDQAGQPILPCKSCGALAVPWGGGPQALEITQCGACGREFYTDEYEGELAAYNIYAAALQHLRAEALVASFDSGAFCPHCSNRLHPNVAHVTTGVPCGRCGNFTPLDQLSTEPPPTPEIPGAEAEPEKKSSNKLIIGCGCAFALGLTTLSILIILYFVLG